MNEPIHKLANLDGVLAVAFFEGDQQELAVSPRNPRGKWGALFEGAVKVLDLSSAEDVRVQLDSYSVCALREGGLIVVAAIISGHPVAKSLRRAIRKCIRDTKSAAAAPKTTPPVVAQTVPNLTEASIP